MPVFRLAHLSDPHLPPPAQLGALRLKQIASRFAWRRKRHRHDPEHLRLIMADIAAAAPDHIAITGDLTNFSTPAEFQAATDWLRGIGPAADITVSPGNHDALVGAAGDRFAVWQPWLGDAGTTDFPYIRCRGHVAIFNLCSAIPTPLHRAQGYLGRRQIAGLAAGLKVAADEGLFRIILVHHPVTSGVVKSRASLADHGPFQAIVGEMGAELVLHGHAHRAVVAALPGRRGPIPVLGVPSASAVPGHGDAARWHLIEIDEEDGSIRVIARGIGQDGTVRELGRYRLAGTLTDSVSGSGSRSFQPSH